MYLCRWAFQWRKSPASAESSCELSLDSWTARSSDPPRKRLSGGRFGRPSGRTAALCQSPSQPKHVEFKKMVFWWSLWYNVVQRCVVYQLLYIPFSPCSCHVASARGSSTPGTEAQWWTNGGWPWTDERRVGQRLTPSALTSSWTSHSIPYTPVFLYQMVKR